MLKNSIACFVSGFETSRLRWPSPVPLYSSQTSSDREAYLARHTALQQFKFEDPFVANFPFNLKSHDHLLLLDNGAVFSEVSKLQYLYLLFPLHYC